VDGDSVVAVFAVAFTRRSFLHTRNMGNKNSQEELDNMIFDMKLQGKQLEREAARSEKDKKAEEAKARRNLERGLVDNARINAENAIRRRTKP